MFCGFMHSDAKQTNKLYFSIKLFADVVIIQLCILNQNPLIFQNIYS